MSALKKRDYALFILPNPISKIKSLGRYIVFSIGEKWGEKQIKKVRVNPSSGFCCLDDSHFNLTRWVRKEREEMPKRRKIGDAGLCVVRREQKKRTAAVMAMTLIRCRHYYMSTKVGDQPTSTPYIIIMSTKVGDQPTSTPSSGMIMRRPTRSSKPLVMIVLRTTRSFHDEAG